jgi:hypothetical protein
MSRCIGDCGICPLPTKAHCPYMTVIAATPKLTESQITAVQSMFEDAEVIGETVGKTYMGFIQALTPGDLAELREELQNVDVEII